MTHARVRNTWWMQHHVHRAREATACSETAHTREVQRT